MANFRIILDFETDDNVTLGMLTRDLENNTIAGDGVTAYKIVEARETTLKRVTKEVEKEKVMDWFSPVDLYSPIQASNPKLNSAAKILKLFELHKDFEEKWYRTSQKIRRSC